MPYRLYTGDVEKDITKFGDEHYHVLAEKKIENTVIAVVYDEMQFIVTYGLHYDKLNSIHWEHGHYYIALLDAVGKFISYGGDGTRELFRQIRYLINALCEIVEGKIETDRTTPYERLKKANLLKGVLKMYTVCWIEAEKDRWDRLEHIENVRELLTDINQKCGGVEDVLIFNPSADDCTINPKELLDSEAEIDEN